MFLGRRKEKMKDYIKRFGNKLLSTVSKTLGVTFAFAGMAYANSLPPTPEEKSDYQVAIARNDIQSTLQEGKILPEKDLRAPNTLPPTPHYLVKNRLDMSQMMMRNRQHVRC